MKLKSNTEKLREWRESRNIKTPNTKIYVENCIEELLEIYYKEKGSIDYLKNEIMDKYFNGLTEISVERTIDTINDISVFSINENENMGYDYDECMSETIMEISSRKQDPEQKIEWDLNGASGKWQKDKNQNKDELYVAKYELCKFL